MTFIILGICLFIAFVFVFLLLIPRPSAAGALLQEVTRPTRIGAEVPAWRTALDVDYLAKPFTLIRSLFTPEPDPKLVHRLMLAGYRKPAHADIFRASRLALPALLGVFVEGVMGSGGVILFLKAVVARLFIPDVCCNG